MPNISNNKKTTNYNISQQKNERETGVDDSTWLPRVHHYAQVAENESSPKVTKYQLNLTKYHTLIMQKEIMTGV